MSTVQLLDTDFNDADSANVNPFDLLLLVKPVCLVFRRNETPASHVAHE